MSGHPGSDGGPTPGDRGRPLCELRDTGLLWLINRVVFHPRGYALALHYTDSSDDVIVSGGEVTGWSLYGDGSEPWSMADPPSELQALGVKTENELFQLVKGVLP